MERILLHACCGPCATHSINVLREHSFEVTLFFSNSNIQPEEEYKKRLSALQIYATKFNIPLQIDNYNPAAWFELVKGYEGEPEGGQRCRICIEARLERAAQIAKERGFKWFTTSLSISPHKNSKVINEIGLKIAQKFDLNFLQENFKKKDGFKKSVEISKEHNLYRQDYCGCIYSIRNK